MHGGKGKLIASIIVVVGIVLFLVFLFIQLGKPGSSEPPETSATSTPSVAGKTASSTPSLVIRFFKLLGYDFDKTNRTPTAPRPEPSTPPSIITGSPAPISQKDLPPGFTLQNISPYYNQVQISYLSHPDMSVSNNAYSELTLSIQIPAKTAVSLTGWAVRSKRGVFGIPRGNIILRPFAPAFTNQEPIIVQPGDTVRIFSSHSPAGLNFRLNKCTGYLQNYTPAIPKTCPYLYKDRFELSDYSGKCQDYITSLGSCEIPQSSPLVEQGDAQCRALLATANYSSCYNAHHTNADFLGNEWRIWMGTQNTQLNIFDPRHDKVQILDTNGKLVVQYIY